MARGNIPSYIPTNRRLPQWANGVIAVGSVALVGFLAYVIYRRLVEKSKLRDLQKTVDQTKADLNNWQKSGGTLTYKNNLSVYNTSANAIANLLDGCDSTDAELQVINTVIKTVKNQGDWLKLQEVFGQRKIDNCFLGTGDTNYTLGDLLKDELDTVIISYGETDGFKPKKTFYKNSVEILDEYFKSKNIQW